MRERSDERGQAVPLLALLVVAIGGLTLGLARFGVAATHAARAQAAADAAALAGAAEDRAAAEALARANGAEVATSAAAGGEVEVRVVAGRAWAVARARATGGSAVGGWVGRSASAGAATRLTPELRTALAAAADLLRQPVPIAAGSGRWVAVPRSFEARLAAVASSVGLCQQTAQTDPVRFQLCQDGPA